MNRFSLSLFLISVMCFLTAGGIFLDAQERQVSNDRDRPRREGGQSGRRQVVLDVDIRVLEGEKVIQLAKESKITIPGTPVSIQLAGSNVAIAAQFTPFLRRQSENVLVAHVQIYITNPDKSVNYYTSMQTIPMEFDEPIYYYPLGRSGESSTSSIEILLKVNRYRETDASETDPKNDN